MTLGKGGTSRNLSKKVHKADMTLGKGSTSRNL